MIQCNENTYGHPSASDPSLSEPSSEDCYIAFPSPLPLLFLADTGCMAK